MLSRSFVFQFEPKEPKFEWNFENRKSNTSTLRPKQHGRLFPDDIFNVWISIRISLKFFPMGPFSNIPALLQIMAWRRPGDKPLSEPIMVSLPTHICVTRPQWVKVPSAKRRMSLFCSSLNVKLSRSSHFGSIYHYPDRKAPRINSDQTLVRHFHVGSLSNRCRCKGLCYLGSVSYLRPCWGCVK